MNREGFVALVQMLGLRQYDALLEQVKESLPDPILGEFRAFMTTYETACDVWQDCFTKLQNGHKLDEAEFYIARTRTSIGPGLPDFVSDLSTALYGEYAIYELLYYQDPRHRGVILPRSYLERRDRERERGESGFSDWDLPSIPHQSVNVQEMTEEQRQFWRAHFPDDYKLFQNTSST